MIIVLSSYHVNSLATQELHSRGNNSRHCTAEHTRPSRACPCAISALVSPAVQARKSTHVSYSHTRTRGAYKKWKRME
jgi:hypothetical protein